jgi:hypothetical protein
MMTEPDDLKLKSKTLAQLEDLYQAMQKLGYPGIAKEVATEIARRRLRANPEEPDHDGKRYIQK